MWKKLKTIKLCLNVRYNDSTLEKPTAKKWLTSHNAARITSQRSFLYHKVCHYNYLPTLLFILNIQWLWWLYKILNPYLSTYLTIFVIFFHSNFNVQNTVNFPVCKILTNAPQNHKTRIFLCFATYLHYLSFSQTARTLVH